MSDIKDVMKAASPVLCVDLMGDIPIMSKSKKSLEEFRKKDSPLKCRDCRKWMRMNPKPGSKCVVRAPVPHASRCVDCLEKWRNDNEIKNEEEDCSPSLASVRPSRNDLFRLSHG